MAHATAEPHIHPDLRVVHSVPGRLRLRARKLYGRTQSAKDVAHKLSGIRGLHRVEANPTTASLTMHYDRSALESVTFFAEVAAALGLVAEGIDPGSVETLFELIGASPADLAKSLDGQQVILPIATFALGLFIGLKLL